MDYTQNPHTAILHKHPHQECVNCVMDTSDPWITFDEKGVCNHCYIYQDHMARIGAPEQRKERLETMVADLKAAGRGKEYDCIMGLSGGVDSSYLAWYAVDQLGLRPLVVHVDTGWNSELAVNNIQNIVARLKLDLHTLVVDWEDIRDLQLAFFRSGVANLDVPQDHAFIASLYKEAKKYGIKDILNGGNMQTESILPAAWGYDASDAKSIVGIHNKFGDQKLKSYQMFTDFDRFLYYPYIARMKTHRPLEYIEYSKSDAKQLLMSELGWRDYGGKHYESVFTKFFQSYYLPVKFGYDKRKAHLASLIVSGQMTKADAKKELDLPVYNSDDIQQDKEYFAKKLGISMNEFEYIMGDKPNFYSDYPNGEAFHNKLRSYARAAAKIKRRLLG